MMNQEEMDLINGLHHWSAIAPDECKIILNDPELGGVVIRVGDKSLDLESEDFLMRLEYALRGFIEARSWDWRISKAPVAGDYRYQALVYTLKGKSECFSEVAAIALLMVYVQSLESLE